VTVIPESSTVLVIAGVCALVTGFGAGGTAAPVNTSALATSAAATQALTELAPVTLAPRTLPGPASLRPPPPSCTASPRDATPSQSSDETITVHTTRGAVVYLVVHYPTATRPFTLVADSAGTAVITFPINRSVPGSPVKVDVSTNSGQVCGTQFTPQ